MLVHKLHVGDLVATGVRVDARKREGRKIHFTLSTGAKITADKDDHIADLMIGHLPARTTRRSSVPPMIKDVRAHSKDWRGENRGRRGERFIARNGSWDYAYRAAEQKG